MSKLIDLTGQRFGKLIVIERVSKDDIGATDGVFWLCLCDCGNYVIKRSSSLLSNFKHPDKGAQSCGCKIKERTPHIKHGGCINGHSRLYSIWCNMLQRCNNPNAEAYDRYGGRGIKVCDEWMDFAAFQQWAIESGYNDSLTIDRIDVDGDYCSDNCRWATRIMQGNNTSRNHVLTYKGETKTVAEWSKITGIKYRTIMSRIYKLNWTVSDALEKPARKIDVSWRDVGRG